MHDLKKLEIKAIQLANEIGLINMTRPKLCERLEIREGSFQFIMGESFTELVARIRPECTNVGTKSNVKGRTSKDIRIDSILEKALDVCEDVGLYQMTRLELAESCGITAGLLGHYFGTMTQLRRAIVRKAISVKRLSIIAQGLALNDPHAKKAPQELKDMAIQYLSDMEADA